MHDYLWPDTIWHYWTERRFRTHCEGYRVISYAGGANIGKSMDAAKIALLFYFANPKGRTVLVASTSLQSLSSRIWGYVTNLLRKAAVPLKYDCTGGQSPKILYPVAAKRGVPKDTIHGMFAVAAKDGSPEDIIAPWIGRHPDDGLLVVLDEATDMPDALINVIPNLEKGQERFQLMTIGNSNRVNDLHGSLSTPLNGWESVDPMRDHSWLTTQPNGICLFFSCYESPAIHEPDPELQKKLGKFLMTKEAIELDKLHRGENSEAFKRFTLGFWKEAAIDATVMDKQFIGDAVYSKSEWSGLYPLQYCAGLDPAFTTGGDQCILRLAQLGQRVDGTVVLDYRDTALLFKIHIVKNPVDSAEVQIAKQVLNILAQYNIPLNRLCIDATGQGRGLAEVIRAESGTPLLPIKIYSVSQPIYKQKSFDVLVKSSYELWFAFREFIKQNQIAGLDRKAVYQLVNRKTELTSTGKMKLESKQSYKDHMAAANPGMAHSPDEADAAALCLQSAILTLGFKPGLKLPLQSKPKDLLEEKIAKLKGTSIQDTPLSNAELLAKKRREQLAPTANFSKGLEQSVGHMQTRASRPGAAFGYGKFRS